MRKYHISILGSLNRLPIILLLLLKYWVLILLQVGLISILLTLVISKLLRIFDFHGNYRYMLDFLLDFWLDLLLSILKFLVIHVWLWQWSIFCMFLLRQLNFNIPF